LRAIDPVLDLIRIEESTAVKTSRSITPSEQFAVMIAEAMDGLEVSSTAHSGLVGVV
jgi:hypothetical protein